MLEHDSDAQPAHFLQTRIEMAQNLFATQLTGYIFIYILYHTVISVGTEYSSAVTLTWKTELHGTGTVACKWQSVPPNLCIILNMISVVLVF